MARDSQFAKMRKKLKYKIRQRLDGTVNVALPSIQRDFHATCRALVGH